MMDTRLAEHVELLRDRVFQTRTKWPHFNLLIEDMVRFARELPDGVRIVSLERNLLYGGFSLFAPLFTRQEFISVDCSPASADERGAYNAPLVDDPRFIKEPTRARAPIENTGVETASADLVMIPNLVHHIADQDAMFLEARRILKPDGKLYVFEPLVRELHQIPDDYLRYTPYGLADKLRRLGFAPHEPVLEGGPFSVIAYCWEQALQYLPEAERKERAAWFQGQHFPELMALEEQHRDNLVRKHTSFPMAFALSATRVGEA